MINLILAIKAQFSHSSEKAQEAQKTSCNYGNDYYGDRACK